MSINLNKLEYEFRSLYPELTHIPDFAILRKDWKDNTFCVGYTESFLGWNKISHLMFHSHVSKWISNDFEKIFFP